MRPSIFLALGIMVLAMPAAAQNNGSFVAPQVSRQATQNATDAISKQAEAEAKAAAARAAENEKVMRDKAQQQAAPQPSTGSASPATPAR